MTRVLGIAAALLAILALFDLSGPGAQAQSARNPERAATILVFDVSNSMWGQIDGVSKIEIAREVIGEILDDWDPNVDLGLVAYGHREKSDCGDIENVIPVGPVDAKSFSRQVNKLVPRGRTPLTDAVRVAAQTLGYTDSPATVILVSDGIESCDADPCALAAELEQGGVHFTAHVVGFDVGRIDDQRQLSCLADLTGGLYLTANNASELTAALETIAAPPPMLRLEAAQTEDGPAITDQSIRWTVVALGTEESVLDGEAMAAPELNVVAGRYFARAELGNRVGTVEFDYSGDVDLLKRVVLRIAATLEVPETVEVETPLSVVWTGPDASGDFVALAEPGSAPSAFTAYARTSGGSPAVMIAPKQPGRFEVRYVDAARGEVLATATVEVIAPAATLDGPAEIEAGSTFSLGWTGPNVNGDFLAIVPAGAEDSVSGNYAYARNGNPAEMRAPDTPGPHELRYVSAQTRSVIARAPIEVIAAAATLEAAPTTGAGAEIKVTWIGPDNRGDYITIVPVGADEGASGNYTYTNRGTPLDLQAPDEPGAYEIRYITGQQRLTLARLPIAVTGVTATIEAAPAVAAGSEVQVTWTGPDNKNDYITIVPAGADEGTSGNYTYTNRGNPLRLQAPDEPGAYEIRYVAGQSRATLGRLPVTVTEVSATIDAAPSAGAGSVIKVTWTGPDNKNDYITIVPAGTEAGKSGNYTYTNRGTPLKLQAPDEPGAYEIRYVAGQSRATLGSLPVTVTAVSATLEAAPAISAGADIKVVWTGPDNKNDFVTIVPVGADDGTFNAYIYTRTGSPLKLRAPDEAGDYELRYVTGQNRQTLVSLPIAVTAVTAGLEAAPAAPAGSVIKVAWTGPDNKNDFVTIVPVGADDGTFKAYTYTRKGNPLKLSIPEEPGSYELRYVSGQSRSTLASIPITITEVTAAIEAAPAAPAGARIKVTWTGPDNRNDYITIVPAGAEDDTRTSLYTYTRKGSTLVLTTFETPGAYELRYVMAQSRRVLARLPITLEPVAADLEAPPVVEAGAKFTVVWSGPDNHNDAITIAEEGSEGKKSVAYVYTRKGSPATIKAPTEPGSYELRYVTAQDKNILTRLPITVK